VREHIAPAVYFLEVHLLYASLVCIAAWLLTSLGEGKAAWKYWIWVATSLNFLVPLAGLCDGFGATPNHWATQLRGLDAVGIGISRHLVVASVFFGVWLSGVAFMLVRLVMRIRLAAKDCRFEQHPRLAYGFPVRLSTVGEGPFVGGVFRSYISLPRAVDRLLSEAELEAVLIHEATHARRRDNLVGLLHEIALCGMWFHPLVWLTGLRLAAFRELSCDDSVIESSRGADLVGALAKLAVPGEASPVRARAASLVGQRVARLTSSEPYSSNPAVEWLLIAVFVGILVLCVFGAVAHYPSCFKVGV